MRNKKGTIRDILLMMSLAGLALSSIELYHVNNANLSALEADQKAERQCAMDLDVYACEKVVQFIPAVQAGAMNDLANDLMGE